MQRYRELAKLVQSIYSESGSSFNNFQTSSGFKCIEGCGRCCLNPDVSASMLEMLPMALELIDSGMADEVYSRLSENLPSCIFYKFTSPDGLKGHCTSYLNRPSICRSFGAGVRISKTGQKDWVICKHIKQNVPELLESVDKNTAPIIGTFASQVASLDHTLGSKLYPINIALKLMLEKLFLLSSYSLSESTLFKTANLN